MYPNHSSLNISADWTVIHSIVLSLCATMGTRTHALLIIHPCPLRAELQLEDHSIQSIVLLTKDIRILSYSFRVVESIKHRL